MSFSSNTASNLSEARKIEIISALLDGKPIHQVGTPEELQDFNVFEALDLIPAFMR